MSYQKTTKTTHKYQKNNISLELIQEDKKKDKIVLTSFNSTSNIILSFKDLESLKQLIEQVQKELTK